MKLYVSYHAPVPGLGPDVFDNPDVIPIQAGANRPGAVPLDMLADNTGRHISGRGTAFGELCAHYWVWRNRTDAEVVGFCNYRRYLFLLPANRHFGKVEFLMQASPAEVRALTSASCLATAESILRYADFIVPRALPLGNSIASQYRAVHRPGDWQVFCDVVRKRLPEFAPSLPYLEVEQGFYRGAIFCATWASFDAYMTALMEVLLDCEALVPPATEPYQQRIFAFLAERFFNLYVFHCRMRVVQVPIAKLDVDPPDASSRR